jgi:hypothetical protein
MKRLRPVVLAASVIMFVIVFVQIPACENGAVQKPVASVPTNSNESTFLGTVTSIDIGNTKHPYLKWVVTLSIDKVDSGPSPGTGFWFAIHSPSQEGVKVGQRYRLTVRKNDNGYELIPRDQAN